MNEQNWTDMMNVHVNMHLLMRFSSCDERDKNRLMYDLGIIF